MCCTVHCTRGGKSVDNRMYAIEKNVQRHTTFDWVGSWCGTENERKKIKLQTKRCLLKEMNYRKQLD